MCSNDNMSPAAGCSWGAWRNLIMAENGAGGRAVNLGRYPNLKAWLTRARPAFQRGVEEGGAYPFAK